MPVKRTTPEILADLVEAIDKDQEVSEELRDAVREQVAEVRELVTLSKDDRARRQATEAAENTAAGWIATRLQANAGKVQLLSVVLSIVLTYLATHYGLPLPLPTPTAPASQPAPAGDTPAETP